MRHLLIVCLVGTLADAAPAGNLDVALTVYNDDLALVEERRKLTVGAGRDRVEFEGVSASILPETVSLTADGIAVVEQNFDYDLMTPAKLMEKAVGQTVRIVRINPGTGGQVTEQATVLSVNNGVVLSIDGRIEVLRADGVPTRVIFDEVPANLRAQPTLSITMQAQRRGTQTVTLSYLTSGLSWKADYVALFDEKVGELDLQGWITLDNVSGTSFEDARLQLIAGDIHLVRQDRGMDWRDRQRISARASVRGGGPASGSGERQLADYYTYPLSERTSVLDNQTKQVSFLETAGVKAAKVYEYRARTFASIEEPAHADVAVSFTNARSGGLGAELPAGVVRVYVRDTQGAAKFVGEDAIEHTPQGSELSIKTGEAFDVTVQPTLVKSERPSRRRYRYSMSYELRNARSEDVTVEVRQGGLWRDSRIVSESLPGTFLNAHTIVWPVDIAAGGETTLTFTVDTGW